MGVWRTSYLIYGFKIEDEARLDVLGDHEEELLFEEPYSEIFNGYDSDQTIISDVMCGQYAYIGLELAHIDELDEGYYEWSEEQMTGLNERLKECMEKWPDYLRGICRDIEPKLYFFIHAH